MALEEIVVTARKREESLQDVPLSITAFSSQMIERASIRHVEDVAKLTPSLIFESVFVPQDTRPVIRGVSSTRGRQPVGILLDGIDVSSDALLTSGGGVGLNLRLVDVERIEVVKGPQSALYGRTAFVGAINYISKRPSDEFEGRFFSDVGDNGQMEFTGSVSGPVSDTVGVRLNASYAEHNGFYTNRISGDKIGGFESYGGALGVEFQPNDDFRVNLRVSYSEDKNEPEAKYVLNSANGGTSPVPLPPGTQPLIDQGVFPASNFLPPNGQFLLPTAIEISTDPRTGEDYTGSEIDAFYSSLLTEYDFGDITLNTWTGYSEVDGFYLVDSDYYGEPDTNVLFPVPGGVAEPLPNTFESHATTTAKQFNQEVRIGDLESDGFRWAVGGLYWDENYDMEARNVITVVVGLPGLSSAALNTRLANPTVAQPVFRNTEHWSVYGILEYDITEQLALSVEARYSDESFDYQWFSGGTVAVSVFGPPAGIGAPGTQFNASASEDFFAPKVVLEYQATDDAMFYASVSKGVKPGGFSTVAAPNLDNARFTAEKLWNYELGTKTTWADGRLTANGSVFFMDYTDKQFQTLIPDATSPTGITGKTVNAANSEIKGFEVDLVAAPTDELSLSFGYAYLDTKYTDFTLFTTSAVSVAFTTGCTPAEVGGVPGCINDFSGNQIERQPNHAMSASGTYSVPVTDSFNAFATVDVQYQSKRFINTSERFFFGAYWNVDARLGVEAEKWSIFAYGENIFEDDTVRGGTGMGDFTAFGNAAFALNAPPKDQYGVRLSYSW